jgi:hypothetical protein
MQHCSTCLTGDTTENSLASLAKLKGLFALVTTFRSSPYQTFVLKWHQGFRRVISQFLFLF